MSTDLETLARRAVACKRWRWMPGMQVVHTPRRDGQTGYFLRLSQDGYVPAENEYPDLTDPATVGCLLALVREAHNAPHAWVEVRYGQRARVLSPDNYSEGARMLSEWQIGTEAAALVAALENANGD